MFIEILNYGSGGCKAKCPTCPQVVSGPNSGPYSDLMFKAFIRIKKRFNKEEIPFSFQNDIVDLPTVLQSFPFNFKEVDYSIGCNIKFPSDIETIKTVFDYLGTNMPKVKFSLFLENRGFLANYKIDILGVIEAFLKSEMNDLSIACHNNSMRINIFDQKIGEMFTNTADLFSEVLKIYPSDSFQKKLNENSIPFSPKNYKQFISNLQIDFPSKSLGLSERILSFEETVSDSNDLIHLYKDYFLGELRGGTFDADNINLALTSLGVRVNHRSIDIRNPYLWLSYDEFFELLENSESIESLSLNLKSSMKKTGFLSCKISEINYETIHILADARRQLGL